MSLLPRHIYSTRQRWRNGSVAACFSWPSNEVIQSVLTTDPVGDTVIISKKMPGWRRRVALGLNATTQFAASYDTLTYRPGYVFIGKWCPSTNRFGFYQYDGDIFLSSSVIWAKPISPPTTIHDKTDAEALIRAVKDARSKQSHFRGGNFLAELGDTIRGLRNPAKGFRELLDTYRRNARKRVKRAVGRRSLPTTQQDFRRLERDAPDISRAAQRALSDTWLEHNFGWQPLLSDAVDAYKALRRLSLRTPLARFYGRSETLDAPSYVNTTKIHEVTTLRFSVRTQIKYDVTYYGAVKVECDAPPAGRAVEEMGVRARDFLPAVWEAIPYSFLIDYFTNIGDIIEAVSFPRSDLAWMARTFRNHSMRSTEHVAIEETSSPPYPSANSNKTLGFTPAFVEWDRKYVFRDAYSGSLIPSFRFEIPGSKNWRKYLNIAALARMRTL